MAETLGVVTGALQLLEAGIKLTKLAIELKNAPESIQVAYQNLEAIKAVLNDLDASSWTHGMDKLMDILKTFRDDLLKLCDGLREYTGASGGSEKPHMSKRSRVRWVMFGSKDFDRAVMRMEQYKSLFTMAISGNLRQAVEIGFGILQAKQKESEEATAQFRLLLDMISDDKDIIKQINQHNEEKKARLLLEAWLSVLDYRSVQSQKVSKHYHGTGLWVLDDVHYKAWKSGMSDSNTLWCYGKAGAGKSIITSLIISDLEDLVANDDNSAVVYIYCYYKEQDARAEDYLACILKQLIQKRQHVPHTVKECFRRHMQHKTRPKMTEMATLLKSTLDTFNQVYVVVDALDECKTSGIGDPDVTRSKLVNEIRKMKNVAFLATSRAGISQFQGLFKETPAIEIIAHASDLRTFISAYIESNNGRLGRKLTGNNKLREKIMEEVIQTSQGMFLMAELLLDYIGQQHTVKRLQASLETLPASLDLVYEKAIDRIKEGLEQDSQLAMKVLAWVALSNRPLTIEEIREALAASEPDDSDVDGLRFDREKMVDAEDILDCCEGLVNLEEGQVRLIHHSLQEYLLDRQNSLPLTEGDIAKACIRYLCAEDIAKELIDVPEQTEGTEEEADAADEKQNQAVLKRYHFISYAAHHWGKHALRAFDAEGSSVGGSIEGAEPSPNDELQECVTTLLFDNPRALRVSAIAVNSFDEEEEFDTPFTVGTLADGEISPLHVAAWHGLSSYVLDALENGYNINLRDEEGHTALSIATFFGQEDVVAALLDKEEIEINTPNKSGITALNYAADNVEMLELFRQYGEGHEPLDINRLDEYGATHLTRACLDGDIGVVNYLLRNPTIDVNKMNVNNETPVMCAILRCNDDVLETLLTREDVDVNKPDHKGYTPLSLAVVEDNETAVHLLFAREDLDVNKSTDEGYTPLHIAAESDHRDIVAALMEREDVRLDLRHYKGMTPLELARRAENYTIITMLRNRIKQDERRERNSDSSGSPRQRPAMEERTNSHPFGDTDEEGNDTSDSYFEDTEEEVPVVAPKGSRSQGGARRRYRSAAQ
ncbi:hypothetical protein BJ508DRAFT_228655 [Ascobolus immersus RN42]|uniref:Uncharacterized protein n=1 Tax=Ascobolus immersus RN42 TaxID=1160509 RepID=A0A3N4HUY4_ASCIM|nr:hypothetical protein BJ508DRAFT_228655 [Ascobolus immersus RN42]